MTVQNKTQISEGHTNGRAVPDVPTMGEVGLKDFDVGTWSGLIGPKNLPADVIRKLSDAVTAAVSDPAIQKRVVAEGAEVPSSARAENARWVKVVREAGIKPQ